MNILLLILIFYFPLTELSFGESRTINVQLTAPWPTTIISPLQEASEFMSEKTEASFWSFLESLRSAQSEEAPQLPIEAEEGYNKLSHEQYASFAIEIAEPLLSQLQLSMLRLTLSIRSFSPLVEAHRSLAQLSAKDCRQGGNFEAEMGDNWVVLSPSGRIVCDALQLRAASTASCGAGSSPCAWPRLQSSFAEDAVDNIGHKFNFEETQIDRNSLKHNLTSEGYHLNVYGAPYVPQIRATLYGRLGSKSLWSFHDELVALVAEGILGE